MKLPIFLYGHPALRRECVDVQPDYPDLKKLVRDMHETMEASDGVGLAAPQVGLSLRMVVINADAAKDIDPACEGRVLTVINPELDILDGPEVTRSEGCLSVPGLSEDVKRVEHVRLNWLDENFEEHEEEFTGFMARIIQHELDHLEGIIYTDRLSPIRKQLIKGKLRNIVAGRTRCDYPARYAPKH